MKWKELPEDQKTKPELKPKQWAQRCESVAAQARSGGKGRKPDQGQVRKSFFVMPSLAFRTSKFTLSCEQSAGIKVQAVAWITLSFGDTTVRNRNILLSRS